MPKIEIDYSNTIIYKITCNDETIIDTYVGHTTNFVQRKYAHKNNCLNETSLNYNCKLYKTIRKYGGWSNWKMEIINFFNCKDNYDARQKEQEYFKLLNANLNSIEPLPEKIITNDNFGHNKNNNDVKNVQYKNGDNDECEYCCKVCNYKCCIKFSYNRHLLTLKHILNEKKNETQKEKKGEKNICDCGQLFKSRTTLWRHKQKCDYYNQEQNQETNQEKLETMEPTTKEIIDLMRLQMLENQELRKMMLSQQQQIIELASKNSITNTNCNNINNNNNTFNLNMFLNEKCKDAINISEFVDNVKIQLSDLENFGHMGYVEGVSRILINNLKDLDTYSRPIHCSDLKREVLYIKDNNEWTKETDDKPVLKQAIKKIANKNIKQIQTWKDENPGCCNSESKKNDQYMKIVMNSMSGGTSEEQVNNISQIVKNVAKVVAIEKSTNK
jgi:hypothetical protein